MYREPHLNEKNAECALLWHEWYKLFLAKDPLAKDARKIWCKCADELGELVSEEVKTNPRYKGKILDKKHPEPPR
jgi:hypothetical protein